MSRKIAGNNKFDFNKPFGGLPKEVWLNANRDCMRIAANRQDKIKEIQTLKDQKLFTEKKGI